jgi:hydroxypyruvate reductase
LDPPACQRHADAIAIFAAAVHAADPRRSVSAAIRRNGRDGVFLAGREVSPPGVVRVVAFGKAACLMAEAARGSLPRELFREPGIAVVNNENHRPVEGFEVRAAGHPVPDSRGAKAAAAIEKLAGSARDGDGLIVLISGGGSALLPAPAEGLGLEEKARVTSLLLASGADIREVNTVRKHLSRLKGGQLAAIAQPAAVESLILSDVIGDDVSFIASGPTAPDPTTFADAKEILLRRGIWEEAPVQVRRRIEEGVAGKIPETPKPGDSIFDRVENRIIGGNRISLAAAAEKARSLGYEVEVLDFPLEGEARYAGGLLASRAAGRPRVGRRAILAGGETTVLVRGPGKGGRNQELALAFAIAAGTALSGRRWTFLSAGTDGRDGPTNAAGAIIEPGSLEAARRIGLTPEVMLSDNDSYPFHQAAESLLITGGTGTNVADLQVYLEG